LWPLGIMAVPNANGMISPVLLADTPELAGSCSGTATNTTIEIGDLLEPATSFTRQFDTTCFEKGVIKWSDWEDTILLGDTLVWYPGAGQAVFEVDATYYSSSASLGGNSRIRGLVFNACKRFLWPPPAIKITIAPSIASAVGVGDKVLLSHDLLTKSDGTTSLEALYIGCMIVEEEWDFELAGAKRLTLWHTAHDIRKFGAIAPAAIIRMHDWNDKSIVHIFNEFTDDDTACFTVGDELLLCDANGVKRSDPDEQAVLIVSLSASAYIETSHDFKATGGAVIYPHPGDLFIGVEYDDAGNTNHIKFHYLADANDTVGTIPVVGYAYNESY